MRPENLHYFPNLCDNFWFNAIWQRQYTLEADRKWCHSHIISCMYGLITLLT